MRFVITLVWLLSTIFTGDARRNVLIILGDDAGFQFGVYGNDKIKTPNVDALAKRSLVFNNGFTSVSSCSPSRSVILSGLPQHQNGMYGLHHEEHHFQSFDAVKSLPNILGEHNIRTGIIGKKHVGPDAVYKFDYEQTEENHDLNQVGRNITCMKHYVRDFLQTSQNDTRPFLLYIGFFDVHRCGGGKLGEFCENFGDGMTPGTGVISDWKPVVYKPEDVKVPYYIPDTPAARQDLANFYKTYSRFDQGVGLFLKELKDAGFADDTLVLFTSDNGIPFPLAKTNLYDPGQGEPFIIHSPSHTESWGKRTDAMASTMASTMDILPTVLDWFSIDYPFYKLFNKPVRLTGKSLLPVVESESIPTNKNASLEDTLYDHVFSSHNFHEVTMYYPLRVLRTQNMKLIHNLNYKAPYPIAGDIFASPTCLDLLKRSHTGQSLHWISNLTNYYHRDEWEMFNLTSDPHEQRNLAYVSESRDIFKQLQKQLYDWLVSTNDPWRCLPGGELQGGKCRPLYNDEQHFHGGFTFMDYN